MNSGSITASVMILESPYRFSAHFFISVKLSYWFWWQFNWIYRSETVLTLSYTMYTYLRAWAVLLFGNLFQHCFSAFIVQILQIWVSLIIGCAILFTTTRWKYFLSFLPSHSLLLYKNSSFYVLILYPGEMHF